ncbi:hypothetical protein [Lentzea sp. HUAS12]|uniref:hypothetical protein n=1 Tax=Lentzea sp. HUAS12 TaxID=2951806 RepID=UPI00209CECC2|nr:hypothetical protein [Lentzea sp. HUAS12]USX56466.1 hypothetical protein ND450_20905 [Lentzea sp. HUAS12]
MQFGVACAQRFVGRVQLGVGPPQLGVCGLQFFVGRLEEQLEAIEVQVREAVKPELLDFLPIAGVDLDLLPDEVSRPLFEALRLKVVP